MDTCATVSLHQPTWAYRDRGTAYGKLGEYERAIQDYSEAIRLDPKNHDAYYNRGVTYFTQGQYELAIQDYDEYIRLRPPHLYKAGTGYRLKGEAYQAMGKLEEAEREFAKAKEFS